MTLLLRFALLALALLPTTAFAHTGFGSTHGFSHGFMHPLGGLDHQLVMVMVGVFAWQLGGSAIWLVPATFVLSMIAGGVLGMVGVPIPFIELGIAASVIVLCAVIAFGIKAPVAAKMAMVGLFAIFHGHAHGSEMPTEISAISYAAGFVIATALLHALGIAIGFVVGGIGGTSATAVNRIAGGFASLAGIVLLVGYL